MSTLSKVLVVSDSPEYRANFNIYPAIAICANPSSPGLSMIKQVSIMVSRSSLSQRENTIPFEEAVMWMETMSSRYRGLVPNLARHTHAGVPASVIPYFRNGYIMPFAAMHPERRLVLIRKLTATVASLHDNGVVHGFIYPMSILVDDHGYPLILPPANGDGHASSQMSGYMTLRALTGEDDVRTAADDVYALLCVVYEIIAGEPVFNVRQDAAPGRTVFKLVNKGYANHHKPANIPDNLWMMMEPAYDPTRAHGRAPSMNDVVNLVRRLQLV